MVPKPDKLRLAILPPVADLYNRLWPDIQDILNNLVNQVSVKLQDNGLDIFSSPAVSTRQQIQAACRAFSKEKVDLLVVALAPYCPSGIIAPSLKKTQTPILLWPMQSIFNLEPEKYNAETVKLNHGVHAVQDLANVLGKNDKAFGVIHGHWSRNDFIDQLSCWAQAGRAICAMQGANPVQIGGHFQDMLDLQIAKEDFLKKMNLKPSVVSLDEFSNLLNDADEQEIKRYIERYHSLFDVGSDVNEALLSRTARGEAALRSVMARQKSHACGLNFLELCNDRRIADALHVAASMLMRDGCGYAGEGDWVTAVLVRGMQQAFGAASFSEIFSVGYADNRLLLKHWGEGNFTMARAKPKLLRSQFTDKNTAEFAVIGFEFEPGPVTLINLNSTRNSQGRVISIAGTITEDHLPKLDGPRAVFKPASENVKKTLTDYAYCGGSHHLTLVKGNRTETLEKISKLSGWSCVNL